MKRAIFMMSALVVVDLLLPDVDTGAQLAIAPAIIAAIIAAVGGMASQSMKKGEGAEVQGAGGAIDMQPTASPQPAQLEQGSPPPAVTGMQGANTPESKHNELIQKADAGKNVGNYPLTPPQAEQFGTGELLTPDFGKTSSLQGGGGTEGMSFDEKMQMAALVAQLGSALSGPGAPPPPGAPRGGGMGMSPVFQQMTARNMYG